MKENLLNEHLLISLSCIFLKMLEFSLVAAEPLNPDELMGYLQNDIVGN